MEKTMRLIGLMTTCLALAAPTAAQQADLSAFDTGPVFEDFGPHAPVEGANELPSLARFETAFDVARKDGRIKPGDLVMFEAMGGGFTWGACLARM